jgi:hypothetical protein
MEWAFVPALVACTSVLACLFGVRKLRLSAEGLGRGIGKALECIGVMLGFFVLNVMLGVAVILLWRQATGIFLSLYFVNDVTLLVIALLQGFVFQWWRRESQAPTRRGEEV